MTYDPFTANKQKVRQADQRLIDRYLGRRRGMLRYLGLPASTIVDILQWQAYFCHYSAVERGRPGEEFRYQHDLMLAAMQHGLASKLELLRGDMDEILLTGHDSFGNPVLYPFDVVSLDYSGGLIYKNGSGRTKRVDSIEALLREQSARNQDFLLLLSCNLHSSDDGEIRRVITDVGAELAGLGIDAAAAVQACLHNEADEARLKVYVLYLIGSLSGRWYRCQYFKPIYYAGNHNTRMMHFSAWLRRTARYAAGRPARHPLLGALRLTAFHCVDGQLHETDFGVPEVVTPHPAEPPDQ